MPSFNLCKIFALLVAIVLYVWLIILAFGAYKELDDGPWKKYAMATFPIGTTAAIALFILIYYAGEKEK